MQNSRVFRPGTFIQNICSLPDQKIKRHKAFGVMQACVRAAENRGDQ